MLEYTIVRLPFVLNKYWHERYCMDCRPQEFCSIVKLNKYLKFVCSCIALSKVYLIFEMA